MAQSLLSYTGSVIRKVNNPENELGFFSFCQEWQNQCSDFINTQKIFSSLSVTRGMKLQTMKWTPEEDVSNDIRLKEYKLLQIASEKPQTKDVNPLNHEQYHDQPSLFRIEHINLTTSGIIFQRDVRNVENYDNSSIEFETVKWLRDFAPRLTRLAINWSVEYNLGITNCL